MMRQFVIPGAFALAVVLVAMLFAVLAPELVGLPR